MDDPAVVGAVAALKDWSGEPQGGGRSRPALPNPVTPISRAGGFYARSWRRYLSQRGEGDLPVLRPTFGLAGQALFDEIVLAAFRLRRPVSSGDVAARIARETIAACEQFGDAGWLDDPQSYHVTPPPLEEVSTRQVDARVQRYERLSFDSGYEPHAGEPGRERWLGYAANRRVRAWMLRHDEPRPWLISVHGASMGRPSIDLTVLKARWLHEELGLNVLQPVLPLHGPRRRGVWRGALFPGEDMLDDVHAAAQSVWDIRRLVSWIRTQDADAAVGITGVSLGGYVTSLMASLEDGLACAIAGVPAVDLVDLLEHHAGLASDDERRHVLTVAKRVGRVVSPLALTPRISHDRRFVFAGVGDRLVHPRHQVARLWEHWGRPEIMWFEGAHIGFTRSKPVSRFLREALRRSGLVDMVPAAPVSLPTRPG